VTRVCSIFSQILQLIPRLEFELATRKHNAERQRAWIHLLGSVRGHALLPARTC
jgi:hypothetical protein